MRSQSIWGRRRASSHRRTNCPTKGRLPATGRAPRPLRRYERFGRRGSTTCQRLVESPRISPRKGRFRRGRLRANCRPETTDERSERPDRKAERFRRLGLPKSPSSSACRRVGCVGRSSDSRASNPRSLLVERPSGSADDNGKKAGVLRLLGHSGGAVPDLHRNSLFADLVKGGPPPTLKLSTTLTKRSSKVNGSRHSGRYNPQTLRSLRHVVTVNSARNFLAAVGRLRYDAVGRAGGVIRLLQL